MRKFGWKKQRVSDAELRQKIGAELPSNADEVQALAEPRKLTVSEVQFYGALAVIASARKAGTFHEIDAAEEKPKVRFRLNRKVAKKRLEKLTKKLSSRRSKPKHQWGKKNAFFKRS